MLAPESCIVPVRSESAICGRSVLTCGLSLVHEYGEWARPSQMKHQMSAKGTASITLVPSKVGHICCESGTFSPPMRQTCADTHAAIRVHRVASPPLMPREYVTAHSSCLPALPACESKSFLSRQCLAIIADFPRQLSYLPRTLVRPRWSSMPAP